MTPEDWGTFGAFTLMLMGLAMFSPRIATVVGVGLAGIIIIQHPTFILGKHQ